MINYVPLSLVKGENSRESYFSSFFSTLSSLITSFSIFTISSYLSFNSFSLSDNSSLSNKSTSNQIACNSLINTLNDSGIFGFLIGAHLIIAS
jgi:hypothetical protein